MIITSMDQLAELPFGTVILWQWRPGRALSTEKIAYGNGWSEGSDQQFADAFERGTPTCTVLWRPDVEMVSIVTPDTQKPSPALIEAAYIAQDDLSKPPDRLTVEFTAEIIQAYLDARDHNEVWVLGHPKDWSPS
ncbi:hypothetical protein SEA_SKOG_92 [Gordonia phage Skog]|uniref:Uncharacterized protein n=1 Tax=Gordonia phage Skog TaxID=2704033 RepID=A0A6G6XJQ0_9CAUD|nr:hypothetical protein KHQ85_gp092 [Gordonia phage Skog]QIG58244.1 hypothetical protein SEA_SKOG_92 [Gordonia phage Skog]